MNSACCKVMSFNYRNGGRSDGINVIENRRPLIIEMLRRERPDVIGFQEVADSEREWLRGVLGTEYIVLGGGRDANYQGEGCPVAFRSDCFELISFESFWLSDTPEVAGSRFHGVKQSPYPRITHVLELKHREASEPIFVINTHLDHESALARRTEFIQLGGRLKKYTAAGMRGLMMGDMNACPYKDEITEFSVSISDIGLSDVTTALDGTYHAFGKQIPALKIDYIFSSLPHTDAYCVKDSLPNGIYCSDHYPICAIFALP